MSEHWVLTRSGKAFIGISKCVQEQRVQRGLRETSPKSHLERSEQESAFVLSFKPTSLSSQTGPEEPFSYSTFILGLVFMYAYARYKEKAMAPPSSTLAWKISGSEEPGRLQSMGSLRFGHDWATSLSLSCTGEGNGNPLQCSCLENPRDGGAWWAAVYGVAQGQTRLKWLSSSSSSMQGISQRSVADSSVQRQWANLQWAKFRKTSKWSDFSTIGIIVQEI